MYMRRQGAGMAFGIVMGIIFGFVFKNIGVGVALGVVFGAILEGAARRKNKPVYSVTKRLDFCYGHRLLNHDGVCRHLHGHNAMVEIDVTAETLDERDMVVDFSDIKRVVKAWIDRELDHR